MFNGKIQFDPGAPKDYGYGETIKFKAKPATGGDLVTLFVKADHPDAPRLVKGVTVYWKTGDTGKPQFAGVDQAAPAPSTPANPRTNPAPAHQDRATVRQIVDTYSAIYKHVAASADFADQDAEGRKAITATIFIECGRQGAWVTAKPKPTPPPPPAPAATPPADPEEDNGPVEGIDDLPF